MLKMRRPLTGQDHPTTILLSVHKGASSFLAESFAPAMAQAFKGLRHVRFHQELLGGRTAVELALPPLGTVTSRVYPPHYDQLVEEPVPADGRFADKKLILLRRDPRDVAVSYYFAFAYSHPPPRRDAERFHERRARMQQMSVQDGIVEYTLRPATRQFLMTVAFMERFPSCCLTTYETLVTAFPTWLGRVQTAMDWTDEEAACVGRGLEEQVTPPAKEDPQRHKRRVTPGNWREVFDDRLRDLFEQKLGATLAEAGYTW